MSIVRFREPEDEADIADIPDLKYCSAGDTPQDALREVLIAKQAWLETAKFEGKLTSVSRYKPVTYQTVA